MFFEMILSSCFSLEAIGRPGRESADGSKEEGESLEFSERLVNVFGKDNDKPPEDEDIESRSKDKLSYSEVS
jgi:hypothetical protein